MGKAGEPELHQTRGLTRGPLKVFEGQSDCALVATGSVLKVALAAARQLAGEGISVSVFSCPWLQPVTAEWFQPFARFQRLLVLEEHVSAGGLASLLCEHLPAGVRVISQSLPATVLSEVGSQDYLRQQAGFSAEEVCRRLSDKSD